MSADWYSAVKAINPALADVLESLTGRVEQLEECMDAVYDRLWPEGDNEPTSLPARRLVSVPKPPGGAA